VTAFFIPGMDGDTRSVEHAYSGMRKQIELELGRLPTARRIVRLWTRRGSVDCITEVGQPDPLRGGTVIAIFDMGLHQPYVVWRRLEPGSVDGVREVLGCSAYSVLEFDA
jgi:hypothetical protein